jgi:Ca-activated chloride channel family protein
LIFSFLSSCDVLIQDELSILSGSENEALEPFFEDFTRESGIKITMKYLGSVEIMMALKEQNLPYDAVWPANSLWITLRDTSKIIKHAQSIFTSPVVFGLSQAKARELGWVGKIFAWPTSYKPSALVVSVS